MNDTIELEQSTVEVQPLALQTVEPTNDKIQTKLNEIRDKVNSLKNDIEQNEVLSRSHGKINLNLALKCGELLSECSEEFDFEDGWKQWVKNNIHVTYQTVRNYIRLWDYQVQCGVKHILPYSECDSLREAYIVCGVVRVKINKVNKGQSTVAIEDGEKEVSEVEKPKEIKTVEEPFVTVKRNIEQLIMVFNKNTNHRDMSEMVKLLKPLVTFYNNNSIEDNEHIENN